MTEIDNRLQNILDIVADIKPSPLLDIGCGNSSLLNHVAKQNNYIKLYGVDVYESESANYGYKYSFGDITNGLLYPDENFDSVVLGEAIEHIPSPDFLLRDV